MRPLATSTQWQLARDAAERYEQILVPAILGPAAEALVEFASPQSSEVLLDVGCGTGVAARLAAKRMGPAGRVVGVDVNIAMIDIARSLPQAAGSPIEWYGQSAYELQFADTTFDVVVCAQTLQFLEDRPRALAQMHRVLKPGGRVVVSLWDAIRKSPYFDVLVQAMTHHIGPETAKGLLAAFGLSDVPTVHTLFLEAGFRDIETRVQQLDLHLPSLSTFVPRHVSATPMAAGFSAASEAQRQAVIQEVVERLASYETKGGVRIPFRTHLVRAIK